MPGNEHRNTPAVKPGKMEEHTNMPNVSETGEQPKRRAVTAESMAAKQRDISVSEVFAKNRHLLGFDNPRKALLTAVKEAVDNSLDACEEAGIVPDITVVIEDLVEGGRTRRAGCAWPSSVTARTPAAR